MRIDQPEDRILEPRLQAIERSMPQLAGQQVSKDPAARSARLKQLTGQLAAKKNAALTTRARTPKCRTGTRSDLRATPIRSGSLWFGC
jgi:hypothetical protein